MTQQQHDAIYAAYLGIHVLRVMLRAIDQPLGVKRSGELIAELEQAFPSLKTRHNRDTKQEANV